MSESIISVEHVYKSVTDSAGTLDILRDIDFTLAERETAAIVGASGSGKSTLLSIVAGLDTPSRGTVRLAGEDRQQRALARARGADDGHRLLRPQGEFHLVENRQDAGGVAHLLGDTFDGDKGF